MAWIGRRPKATVSASRRTERGGVLVEMTLVIPLLVFLVLGSLELGLALSDSQVVTQAARSGARTVSGLSSSEFADREALLAITASFGQDDIALQQVTIFEAGPNGERPAACLGNLPVNGGENCNIYPAAVLTQTVLQDPLLWGCDQAGRVGTHDDNWCPSVVANRNPSQASATWIGVHVVGTRQWQTGFFGSGTQTITETAVMRMEPRD